MASVKSKVSAAMLQLDDLQLDEPDSSSPHYKAISDIKSDLKAATDIIDGRLDLIEKVDNSKVGWAAAAVYEKMNGPITKADSDKVWAEAEKTVEGNRKKEKSLPFRAEPVHTGRDQQFYRSSRGSCRVFCFSLFFLAPSQTGLYICIDISLEDSRRNSRFSKRNDEFLRKDDNICKQRSPRRFT